METVKNKVPKCVMAPVLDGFSLCACSFQRPGRQGLPGGGSPTPAKASISEDMGRRAFMAIDYERRSTSFTLKKCHWIYNIMWALMGEKREDGVSH